MKILIAGEGGQGIQTIGEILAEAAFEEGKSILYIPNFGVEQRGGISLAFLVVDNKKVIYPKFEKADILGILSDRSFQRVERYIGENTKIIYGPGVKNTPKSNLPPRVWNIIVLGKINKMGKLITQKTLEKIIDKRFYSLYKLNPYLKEINRKALYSPNGEISS